MKTQVIQLEPYDDVISVRDKMSWAKTDRILLVIPRRSKILPRILDLRLIQRHADLVGAQLAIVTRNLHLRLVAQDLDIPVFSKLSNAKRRDWQVSRAPHPEDSSRPHPDLRQMREELSPPESAWQKHPLYRLGIFSLAVLAILAVLLTLLPSAAIQLQPATQLQTLTLKASASPDITAIDLAGDLPSRSTSVIVENTRSSAVTGSLAIPRARASGTAQFRNLTNTAVSIPTGTVISTQTHPIVRFMTTNEAQLAAGVNSTVDVPVAAVEPGSSGNLPANALVAMQGDLGTSLAVTNTTSTTGGTDQIAAIQTAQDRTRLRAGLMADLLGECKTELQQTLSTRDIFFPDSLADSQVLAETFFPAQGQAGDTLTLTLRVKCQAQFSRAQDLNQLAEMILDVNLPDGFGSVPGSLSVQQASPPVTDPDGTTHWDLLAQRRLQASLNPLRVEEIVLGHRPGTAINLLERNLPLAEPPFIQMEPGWWPWMPLIPYRIKVSTGR